MISFCGSLIDGEGQLYFTASALIFFLFFCLEVRVELHALSVLC